GVEPSERVNRQCICEDESGEDYNAQVVSDSGDVRDPGSAGPCSAGQGRQGRCKALGRERRAKQGYQQWGRGPCRAGCADLFRAASYTQTECEPLPGGQCRIG